MRNQSDGGDDDEPDAKGAGAIELHDLLDTILAEPKRRGSPVGAAEPLSRTGRSLTRELPASSQPTVSQLQLPAAGRIESCCIREKRATICAANHIAVLIIVGAPAHLSRSRSRSSWSSSSSSS